MKKAIYNKAGTRQLVNTGFKRFDVQTNCISTGNVLANTQLSYFIRPYGETKCNGYDFSEGHLMNADLKLFGRHHIPEDIEKLIRDKERKESVILYMFYTRYKGFTDPFCWILTDKNHNHIKSDVVCYGSNVNKRWNAMLEIRHYITNDK